MSLGYPYQEGERQKGKGKKRRNRKERMSERGGKGRKSAELKNTEKQKDRRINSKRDGLPAPQRPHAFGQAADTLRRSCLFFFCSVLDRKFAQRGHVYLCLLLDSVSRIKIPTYEQ